MDKDKSSLMMFSFTHLILNKDILYIIVSCEDLWQILLSNYGFIPAERMGKCLIMIVGHSFSFVESLYMYIYIV